MSPASIGRNLEARSIKPWKIHDSCAMVPQGKITLSFISPFALLPASGTLPSIPTAP
jgi:hypothetical protein